MVSQLLAAVLICHAVCSPTLAARAAADNPLGLTVEGDGSYRLSWAGQSALNSAPVGLNTANGWCAAGDCLTLSRKTTADGVDVLGAFHRTALYWAGPEPLTFVTAFRVYSDRPAVVFEAEFPSGVLNSSIPLEHVPSSGDRSSTQRAWTAQSSSCTVSLMRQVSVAKCELGQTFGCFNSNNSMWINGGCRGVFMCNGEKDVQCESTTGGTSHPNLRQFCTCAPSFAGVNIGPQTAFPAWQSGAGPNASMLGADGSGELASLTWDDIGNGQAARWRDGDVHGEKTSTPGNAFEPAFRTPSPYQGGWKCDRGVTESTPYGGSCSFPGSNLALFNENQDTVLIMSALTHFDSVTTMRVDPSFATGPATGVATNQLRTGVVGSIKSIPEGHKYESIVYGGRHGINSAFEGWGRALLDCEFFLHASACSACQSLPLTAVTWSLPRS